MADKTSHLRAVPSPAPGAPKAPPVEPYNLAPGYEAALVTSLCSRPLVYAKVGALLDPKALGLPAAQLAVKAAQSIADDVGKGPTSCALVLQRLVRWRDEGGKLQVTQEEIESVVALFDAAHEAGLPDADAVCLDAAHLLKQRAKHAVVQKAMSTVAARGSFDAVAKAAAAVERIGVADESDGSILGVDSFASIDRLRLMERLPTRCPEFDNVLGGGLPRGYTLFLGREKAGKSLVLSSIAAQAFYDGLHVCLGTLELAEELQQARIIANLTGVPIDEIIAGRTQLARERLEAMAPRFGLLSVKYFSPRVTTTEALHGWLDAREQKTGRKVDVFVLDYVDKVSAPKSEASEYMAQAVIGDALRDEAHERKRFLVSASQARRAPQGKKKKLDNDDAADSMHKVRIPDAVVALRMSEDESDESVKDTVDYFLSAGRLMKDRVGTGSLPVDRATGRMFPVNREEGW